MKRFKFWTFQVFFYLCWIALLATIKTSFSKAHIIEGLLFVTGASIVVGALIALVETWLLSRKR